jgi:hypothetical protein
MTKNDLRLAIKRHNGPIYAGVLGNNDVHYVRVVKSDLLDIVTNIVDHELDARISCGGLYIDRSLGEG